MIYKKLAIAFRNTDSKKALLDWGSAFFVNCRKSFLVVNPFHPFANGGKNFVGNCPQYVA